MAQENKNENQDIVIEVQEKKTIKDRVHEHPMATGVVIGVGGAAAAYGVYALIKHLICGSDDDDDDSDDSDSEPESIFAEE